MAVWKLETRKTPSAVQSSWKPQGAGDPGLRCEFTTPPADGSGAVGTDGTLRIHAEAEAYYEPNRRVAKAGSGPIEYPGQGITSVRVALRRGATVWMDGARWVRMDPAMALRHRSVAVTLTTTENDAGTVSMTIEADIDADRLGPGPLTVQIYLEGHPRELTRHRKRGWDPAVAGTFTTTVTVDGEAPETYVDLVVPTDDGFYIVGRAADNHEVEHVLLTVMDDVTGEYLGSDHRWQNRAHAFEVPHSFGVWSWEFPHTTALPGSGDYSFVAQAEDTAERDQTRDNRQRWGNLDPTPVRHDLEPRQP